MNVVFVGKCLQILEICQGIRGFTQEKNNMNAACVVNDSMTHQTWANTRKLTVRNNNKKFGWTYLIICKVGLSIETLQHDSQEN